MNYPVPQTTPPKHAEETFPARWLFWPLLAVTLVYAVFLVWATHHPRPGDLLGPSPPPDKLLHFIAYGLLGFLVAATVATTGRWSRRGIVLLAVGLALAGIVDEATQPLFGRGAEVLDWGYDVIGICTGIAVVAIGRWRLQRASRPFQ